MLHQALILMGDDWQAQIAYLQAELEQWLPQLVEAEAELAELHANIHSFEFRLRSRLAPFTRRLEKLDEEINALRRQLRLAHDGWYAAEPAMQAAAWANGEAAAEAGEYRYRELPTAVRPEQDEDTRAEMKKLYRQLALRFHPDTAVDEAAHQYNTQLMVAINMAYAAGDLDKLRELAESPDRQPLPASADAAQKKAERLLQELTAVQRRMKEVQQELRQLQKHESAKMMKKMAQAEANGRDYFADLEEQMQDLLAQKMAQRDSLQVQLESIETDEAADLSDDELADIVWDVSLENSFNDDDISAEFDRYIRRRRDRIYFEEDFDDDFDFE